MSETKIVTNLVRFSYAKVFEPSSIEEGGEKKYSVSILIPKKNKTDVAKIKKAIQAAIDHGKADKFGGKDPSKSSSFKMPLRDGDEEREDNPEYEGMYFINASSKNKPGLVDANRDEIRDPEDFYSGCWGRASLNFYPFSVSGSKGIAAGLNNRQKLKDDEHLDGRTSAADDFDDDFADDFDDVDDDMLD